MVYVKYWLLLIAEVTILYVQNCLIEWNVWDQVGPSVCDSSVSPHSSCSCFIVD